MNLMNWDSGHMDLAMKIVKERFAMNSVAGHFAPQFWVDKMARAVPSNRFDYAKRTVVDDETLNLYEPFARCNFTLAQMNEFGSMTDDMLAGDMAMQNKVVATITRAASALARWHDFLFFVGLDSGQKRADLSKDCVPIGVEMGRLIANTVPVSLQQAARQAEKDLDDSPMEVIGRKGIDLNEGLVAAVYGAVLKLETRGYYNSYHLVLGEELWEELHRPTAGSMVLPKDRIEPTLLGGHCHRTTTLPKGEALLASLDGPTFECVVAGSVDQHPRFDVLAPVTNDETLYQFRVVDPFVPRIRENQSIVRLQVKQAE
jgi:hypothetical protein